MADINKLKDKIKSTIYPNGKGAINASDHQAMLLDMADGMAETDTKLATLSEETDTKLATLSEETETIRTEVESQSELIEDLQNTKIDKEADDYYPQLSVGVADNLAGHEDATPSEIGFRRSGGGAILDGNARIEAIKGNSVVWNQLITLWKGSSSAAGVTIMGDTEVVANGTSEKASAISLSSPNPYMIRGHKYFMRGCPSSGSSSTYYLTDQADAYDYGNGVIFTAHYESGGRAIIMRFNAGVTFDNVVFRPQLFDLTLMFGAGNEPTTIEEFYARKPLGIDEYAYNEGEVIHNATDKIESVGVNQWDEEWELGALNNVNSTNRIRSKNLIPVLPSAKYYFYTSSDKGYYFDVAEYDENKIFLRKYGVYYNAEKAVSNDARYIEICLDIVYGITYNHDICINLSDPSVNGKYFPYVKREQSLDIIGKYFPNGMKSAGSAHDEIRYNKVTQKWEYSKGRLRSVDLGSLTWNYYSSSNTSLFKAQFADIKIASSKDVANMLCAPYTANNANTWQDDKTIVATPLSGVQIWIHEEAYKDNLEAFKAAMQGVILYYESNDWEWVELDAEDQFKNLDYPVWNVGTEKASANVPSTPLKADIIYGFNAYGVIKELLARVASLEAANASLASQLASVTSHNEEV